MFQEDQSRIAARTDQLVQAATREQQEAQAARDHLAYLEKAQEAQGKVRPDNMTPEQRERAAAARARQAQRERELETETNGSAGGWHGAAHVWAHMMPQQQQQSGEQSSPALACKHTLMAERQREAARDTSSARIDALLKRL